MKKLFSTIVVLGLLLSGNAYANNLGLNKCFMVEFTQDGKTTKVDSSFDSGNYYKIREEDMKYVSAYYKLNEKIKKYDNYNYSINISNSTVNKTIISTDEFNQFVYRSISKMYPDRNFSSSSHSKKVKIEDFEIKNYNDDFIITKIKKVMVGLGGTEELKIDLNNSIIYIYKKDQSSPEGKYDTTIKVQCDNKNKIELAKIIDKAKDTCKSLGFEEGTEKFADCSLKLYSQSVELAAEQNKTVVMQPQSSGSNVMTIYDPARESRILINKGQRMLSGACTLGIDC